MSLWSRLRNTLTGRVDDEIAEELQFHLEMERAGGRTPRDARLRLGNVVRIKEETRAMSIIQWLESAIADARYGFRQLRSAPLLVVAVVLSLTLGLGASTAIFALVDAAILKPLPIAEPDRLVILEWTADDFPPGVNNLNGEFRRVESGKRQGSSIAASLYRRLAREQTGFAALVGVGAYPDAVALAVDGAPAEQGAIQYVSDNYFQVLGVEPPVGRAFLSGEDQVGHEPVVIISHRLWLKRFAGDRGVIDRSIRINSVPARIVGVAPPGFFGTRAGQWPDAYAPLAIKPAFTAPAGAAVRAEDDTNWWVRVVARLRPDVPEPAATARIAAQFRGLATPPGVEVDPGKVPELAAFPGRRGFASLGERDTDALWTLLLLVGVLLLIVCANVANLLLSRSVARHHESAMRLALGATRARVFRQHLIEGAMLSLVGGAAGLFVGEALAQSIHVLFQTGRDASNAFDLHIDRRVVLYTALLSLASAFLFGLAPAWRAARTSFGDAIKAQTRSIAVGRLRLPRALVAIQIALCLAALVAAGLLGRSLARLKSIDIGFDREGMAYASVSPSRAGYPSDRISDYAESRARSVGSAAGSAQRQFGAHAATVGWGKRGPGQHPRTAPASRGQHREC